LKSNSLESSPVPTSERIASLDIIRGFALFGILFVNMPLFQGPRLIEEQYAITPELGTVDQFLRMLLDVFIETKFFAIFSLLFGVGFYIFMKRAEEKGRNFKLLYSRRLIVLALFGFLHLVFFWYGDILLRYALSGFLLFFFYKRKEKTILLWLASFVVILIGLLSFSFFGSTDSLEQQISILSTEGAPKVEEAIYIYNYGAYYEWLSYRFTNEVIPVLKNIPFAIITSLFYFLIGLYAAQKGIFINFPLHKKFIKRVWLYSLLISIPFSVGIIVIHMGVLDFGILNDQLIESFVLINGLGLSLFYITTILLILGKGKWNKLLHPLGYVGRMALTNYIVQTLICVGIFTGFGIFGGINLRLGIVISFIIFLFQILYSLLWLKYFRFGPLEWIWRSLTYGRFQHIKLMNEKSKVTS